MIMMFGQAGPGAYEIWIVLGGAAVLASILGNIAQWQMSRRKRERVTLDQPLDVNLVTGFVRKEDCRLLHEGTTKSLADLKSQLTEVRETVNRDRTETLTSRGTLNRQIAEIREDMGEMERRLNETGETRITKVHDRINDVLSAVSRLDGKISARTEREG